MDWSSLWNYVQPILTASAGSVITLLVAAYTKFGDVLFKHVLDRNMADYQAQLAHRGDRGARSNELEYKAIVTAWEAYVEAYLSLRSALVDLVEHETLSSMSADELQEWMKIMQLPSGAVKQITTASNKDAAYEHYLEWRDWMDAYNKNIEAREAIRQKGIFIPRDLEQMFLSAIDRIAIVIAAKKAKIDRRSTPGTMNTILTFQTQGEQLYDALKDAARTRLMYQESQVPAAQ